MLAHQIYPIHIHIRGRKIHRLQSKLQDAIIILVLRTKISRSKIRKSEFKCAQTWETQRQSCLTWHPKSLSVAKKKHQNREEKNPKPNQANKIHRVTGMTVLIPMREKSEQTEKIEGRKSRRKAEQREHRPWRSRCRLPWNPRLRRTRWGRRPSMADRWRKLNKQTNRVVIGTRARVMSGCEIK